MKKLRIRGLEYKYIVAMIYVCVLFLDRLDLTIVNITLPTLAQYFHVPITKTEWVANAFLFALAISIPISGWLGEKFGTKLIFIVATTVFGLASFLCAFAPNLTVIIILRFLQGLGGGMLIPVGMSMVYSIFEPSEYASITSYTFIPTLIAPAIAPFLGGLITSYFSWKWVFIFGAPICFFAVVLSFFILKENKPEEVPPLDSVGFILVSSTLIALLFGLSHLGTHGFTVVNVSSLVMTAVLAVVFIRVEKGKKHALINLNYFKRSLFSQANIIQLAFQMCHFGSIFLVGMYLQAGLGMSASIAGLIMGMQALGAICTSRYSVKLFHSYGASVPIIAGFIGVSVFSLLILCIQSADMVLLGCVILFIRGLFSGLCGTPIHAMSILDFNKNEIARASAVFNAGRQVAISLGVALSSLLIAYGYKKIGPSFADERYLHALHIFKYAFFIIPLLALFGVITALLIDNKKILLKIKTVG